MTDPAKTASLSDKQITDFFHNKTSWKKKLTAAEIVLIRAAASPTLNRWTGTCDVDRMAELIRKKPARLESVGPFLMKATLSMNGCAAAAKFSAGPGRAGEFFLHRLRRAA
jgi:hypothetical protein